MAASPRHRRWPFVAAFALVLGACGGDDGDVAVQAEAVQRPSTTAAPTVLLDESGELQVREGAEHRFDADAGTQVTVRIDGGRETLEPTLDLLAPSGSVVFGGIAPPGESVRTLTLPESGTYRVVVSFALVREGYRVPTGWYTYAITIAEAA